MPAASIRNEVEAAIIGAGLGITLSALQLHGGARASASEEDGRASGSQQLLWVSRMLRNRAAYEKPFGTMAVRIHSHRQHVWGVSRR